MEVTLTAHNSGNFPNGEVIMYVEHIKKGKKVYMNRIFRSKSEIDFKDTKNHKAIEISTRLTQNGINKLKKFDY